jgi:anti-anti-sigma regulatory factor
MEPSFKIDLVRDGNEVVALFSGNIDAQAEPHFEDLLKKLPGGTLTMDFSQTGRINSMGIALVLRSIKSIKSEKRSEVRVQGLNQINSMLFKMTGIFMLAPENK